MTEREAQSSKLDVRAWRKRPVVVEAVQFTGGNGPKIAGWTAGAARDISVGPESPCLVIRTLEGNHRADVGDWIIRGVQGEFYPCKPDIFAATYEPAPRGAVGDETEALRAELEAADDLVRRLTVDTTTDFRHEIAERREAIAALIQPYETEVELAARVAGLEAREAALRDALKRMEEPCTDCNAVGLLNDGEPCEWCGATGLVLRPAPEITAILRAALADSGEAGS